MNQKTSTIKNLIIDALSISFYKKNYSLFRCYYGKNLITLWMVLFFSTLGYSQLITNPTSTQPSGSGSVSDPWLISNLAELRWISEQVEGGENFGSTTEQFFVQTADIDASETANWDFNDDGTAEGWKPIGFSETYGEYSSIRYDGHGYSISDLYINRPDESFIGLFGVLDGRLLNINLTNVNITGLSSVGAVLGKLKSGQEKAISSCKSSGTVTGNGYNIGGIIGNLNQAMCDIENCYSSCTVTNSSSSGSSTGGLIGYMQSSFSDPKFVTSIKNCFSTGDVISGGDYVGGLIGYTGTSGTIIIENSFSTGDVTGNSGGTNIGAFIGMVNSAVTVNNCYTTGSVYGPSATSLGFFGKDWGASFSNNYFDSQASNQSTASGATGLTTSQMMNSSNFNSWDFDYVWDIDGSTNGGYPHLFIIDPVPFSGSGTQASPYLISSLSDLQDLSMRSEFWGINYYFRQTTDINASSCTSWNDGDGFRPIGSNQTFYFCGYYDGDYHTIDQLYASRTGYGIHVAFIGGLNGQIENLGVTNVDFTNDGEYAYAAGMFAVTGSWMGKVYNSYTTGTITGTRAGGFTGYYTGSRVEQCYSNCNVTANEMLGGGFVAYSRASIYNSYCTGNVTRAAGSSYTTYGGFAGQIGQGYIQRSYSTGKIIYADATNPTDKGFIGASSGGSMRSCIWNITTSEQLTNAANSSYVKGMTTAEMQDYNNFTEYDNGFINTSYFFDFVTNPNDDYLNNDYWDIDQNGVLNNGFPILHWEDGADDILEYTTYTWDGSSSTDWNTAANWDTEVVPNSSTAAVVIPTEANMPIISSGSFEAANVTIESDASLSINSGAGLTTNGMSLEDGASFIDNGTFTNNGTFTAERIISNGQWHMISSPVEDALSGMFEGKFLQTWNEEDGLWYDISSLTAPLTPIKGYGFWSNGSGSETYTFTGTPNTGSQSIDLTTVGSGGQYERANLLGNPFPSAIDWDLVSYVGSVYLYNGTAYESFASNKNIAPMQGFFVVPGSAGSFTLNNDCRVHDNPTFYKQAELSQPGLVLVASNGSYEDKLNIVINDEATSSFDQAYDAWKFKTNTEGISQLWSISNEGELSIDARPFEEVIPLGFTNDINGNFSISIKEIESMNAVELEDTKLNHFHDLTQGAYSFDWNTSDSEERFILHLKATGTEDLEASELTIYSLDGRVYIRQNETNRWKEAKVYDLAGRVVYETPLNSEVLQSFELNQPVGAYLVQLMGEKSSLTEKVILE